MTDSLQDIKIFTSIYEERSFTAAAVREHSTQSGISHHIKKLEDRLNTQLFIRGSGVAVKPTPAGEIFYKGALKVLKAHDEMINSIEDYKGNFSGEIKIGLIPAISRGILAPSFAEFTENYPNIKLTIIEGFSHILPNQVRSGELDFAISVSTIETPGLLSTYFSTLKCYLILGKKLEHYDHRALNEEGLGNINLILARPPNSVRLEIDKYLARNKLRVGTILEIDSVQATLEIVSRTNWATILPGPFSKHILNSGEFIFHPIEGNDLIITTALLERPYESLSKKSRIFIDILKKESEK